MENLKIWTLSTLFLLVIMSSGQPCLLKNCLQCPTTTQCSKCETGLTCCQRQCQKCEQNFICKSCDSLYFLNNLTGFCQLIDSCQQPMCNSCSNNICSTCIQGYVLRPDTFQCQNCPYMCSSCDIFGKCYSCYLGYFVGIEGQCQDCTLPRCLQCQSQFKCLQCQLGYAIQTVQPFCSSCPSNCEYCAVTTSCQLCKSGFFLTSTFKCSPCTSTCQNCFGTATNCTLCQTDKYLLNNQCVYCEDTIPFCVTCLSIGEYFTCLNCSKGMFPNEGGQSCSICPEACATCASLTTCYSCITSYFLNTTTMMCMSCEIENCVYCSNSSYCRSCISFYSPTSSKLSCTSCSLNCYVCSGNVCNQCMDQFHSIGNMCYPCPVNCASCPYYPTCSACMPHFYLIVSLYGSICNPCPLYCTQCRSASYCLNCFPGFINIAGICQQSNIQNCFSFKQLEQNQFECSACTQGYYLNQGKNCLQCLQNCLICNNLLSCTICFQGYYLNENICTLCPNNCILCASNSSCLACGNGYYLSSITNLCSSCTTACLQCTSASNCQKCAIGYYQNRVATLNSFVQFCIRCQSNCIACTSNSSCSLCAPRYGFNKSGVCESCSEGCLTCNFLIGCQTCAQGYYLNFQQPGQTHYFCQPCSFNCFQCASGLYFELKISIPKCLQCIVGYQLLQNGSCYKCGSEQATEGCQTCNMNGLCVSCYSGFDFTKNGECVNVNYHNSDEPNWPLIGTTIGLGCLAMILLIIVLYQNLNKRGSAWGLKWINK